MMGTFQHDILVEFVDGCQLVKLSLRLQCSIFRIIGHITKEILSSCSCAIMLNIYLNNFELWPRHKS